MQSIERGLAVLAHLNRVGSATGSQLAGELGLKRSTAHRMLGVLTDLNLVSHDRLNHQYLLSAGVLSLSSGYHDDDWITMVAEPRMSAWTLEQHWPLFLTTPIAGELIVRVSTDHLSPVAGERLVVGQSEPVARTVAGALYRACAGAGQTTAADSLVRSQGYAVLRGDGEAGPRLGVPLVIGERYVGSLSMRCLPELIGSPRQLAHWVEELRQLAGIVLREAGLAAPARGRE